MISIIMAERYVSEENKNNNNEKHKIKSILNDMKSIGNGQSASGVKKKVVLNAHGLIEDVHGKWLS